MAAARPADAFHVFFAPGDVDGFSSVFPSDFRACTNILAAAVVACEVLSRSGRVTICLTTCRLPQASNWL